MILKYNLQEICDGFIDAMFLQEYSMCHRAFFWRSVSLLKQLRRPIFTNEMDCNMLWNIRYKDGNSGYNVIIQWMPKQKTHCHEFSMMMVYKEEIHIPLISNINVVTGQIRLMSWTYAQADSFILDLDVEVGVSCAP